MYTWKCESIASFLIRISGEKRPSDVYQYWISVFCNTHTKRVILFFFFLTPSMLTELKRHKESQSIKSLRDWASRVLGEQEQSGAVLLPCVCTCVCMCVEGNVSLPLTVGARPAYCTVKTGALNYFRHRALSNECDSNRSSWGHRH